MLIPKTIIQTFSSKSDITLEIKNAINSWKANNKDWEHKIFYDIDCKEFLLNNFNEDVLKAFNIIKPGAGKADLFRYCYLYINGGVYTDIDNICVKPLDYYITKSDEFVIPTGFFNKRILLETCFIACIPNHKYIKTAIDLCVYNVLNRFKPKEYLPLLKLTGPKLFSRSVNICKNKPIDSEFNQNEFKLKFRKVDMLKNFRVIKNQKNEVLTKCGYEGYEPKNHWTKLEIYN
mgnify:FL=1